MFMIFQTLPASYFLLAHPYRYRKKRSKTPIFGSPYSRQPKRHNAHSFNERYPAHLAKTILPTLCLPYFHVYSKQQTQQRSIEVLCFRFLKKCTGSPTQLTAVSSMLWIHFVHIFNLTVNIATIIFPALASAVQVEHIRTTKISHSASRFFSTKHSRMLFPTRRIHFSTLVCFFIFSSTRKLLKDLVALLT